MKASLPCLALTTLLALGACAKSDSGADQRVRILRAQLQQASSQIHDLQTQVAEQQQQLDLKIGACCTSGTIPTAEADSNSVVDDDARDVGNETSDTPDPSSP